MNKLFLVIGIICSLTSFSIAQEGNIKVKLLKELDVNFNEVEGIQFHKLVDDYNALFNLAVENPGELDIRYHRIKASVFGVIEGYKSIYDTDHRTISKFLDGVDNSFGVAIRYPIYRTMEADVPTHFLYEFKDTLTNEKFILIEFIHVDLFIAFKIISE